MHTMSTRMLSAPLLCSAHLYHAHIRNARARTHTHTRLTHAILARCMHLRAHTGKGRIPLLPPRANTRRMGANAD